MISLGIPKIKNSWYATMITSYILMGIKVLYIFGNKLIIKFIGRAIYNIMLSHIFSNISV